MRQFEIPFRSLNNGENYNLCSYGRWQYVNDWQCYKHMHSFTEIFFITDGEGVFHTNDAEFPIRRGNVIVNTPSVVHTEIPSKKNPLSYAVFCVENLTFKIPSTPNEKTFIFDFSANYDQLFKVLEVIEREYCEKAPFWQQAVLNEFNVFMLFLMRNTNLETLPFDSTKKSNSISAIKHYLDSHYQGNLTLDSLSKNFFLNKYYIAHAFNKKYGVPIMRYLNDLRCREGAHLLKTTDLSVTEIAISIGYNSAAAFTDNYKKIVGETPAETRRNFFKEKSENT